MYIGFQNSEFSTFCRQNVHEIFQVFTEMLIKILSVFKYLPAFCRSLLRPSSLWFKQSIWNLV